MVTSEARNSGVRLTDLTKSYGEVKAVRGVNISIRPGETLALSDPTAPESQQPST
jgi:ABC-type sugar transport system ATPase subunit